MKLLYLFFGQKTYERNFCHVCFLFHHTTHLKYLNFIFFWINHPYFQHLCSFFKIYNQQNCFAVLQDYFYFPISHQLSQELFKNLIVHLNLMDSTLVLIPHRIDKVTHLIFDQHLDSLKILIKLFIYLDLTNFKLVLYYHLLN